MANIYRRSERKIKAAQVRISSLRKSIRIFNIRIFKKRMEPGEPVVGAVLLRENARSVFGRSTVRLPVIARPFIVPFDIPGNLGQGRLR
jgi:hypothetical protein